MMKTLKLYKFRKTLLRLFLVVCCLLILTYLMTEDWNNPNLILLFSLLLNTILVVYVNINYSKGQTIQLHNDRIVFRTIDMKTDQTIEVNEKSNFSHDWKGIYITNENVVHKIPLELISKKGGEQIFTEIQEFYG